MVMEASPSPSPQSVGREFVRQYYTLLNKAPTHLHRFYNNFSSFVHGGLEAPQRETLPVVGQKQIHNRIQQLNFRDCHAKISQVDSQATLGSGVVVQVTGELSNAGAPMRRFTQTFVLAAQSPKKYYVHNDIFRYQDLVPEDEPEPERDDTEPAGYFPAPPAFPPLFPAPPRVSPPLLPPPQLNGHPAAAPAPAPSPPPAPAAAPDAPLAALAPLAPLVQHAPSPPQEPRPVQHPIHSAVVGSVEPEAEPLPAAEPAPEPEPPREPTPPPQPQPQPQPAAAPSPPEPKTYANLLKSSAPPAAPLAAPAAAPVAAAAPPPAHEPPPRRPQRAPRDQHHQAEGVSGGMRGERGERGDRGERTDRGERGERGEGSRRYSDSQQLFLGNVPPSATEDELRALFARFGPVAELRVLGRAPHPHYGFVTYESARHAQDCLGATPLYFPPDSPDGVKLNVEEKKTRGAGPGAPRAGEAPRRRPNSTHRTFPPRQPYRR